MYKTSIRPAMKANTDVSYIQSRAEMDFTLIDEYAAEMRREVQFPPTKGINVDGHIYIYDGAHRFEAAMKAGPAVTLNIECEYGTRVDAEWLAQGANTDHGLRRSHADKQRVTKNALLLRPEASDREISRHCQVDHKTVGKLRADLVASGEIPQIDERTVERNGKTFTQKATKTKLANQVEAAAEADPKYSPVWQLEQTTQMWLTKKWTDTELRIKALAKIKERTKRGNDLLAQLANYQQSPHRKNDLRQACNNVLQQMKDKAEAKDASPATCADCGTTQGTNPKWIFGPKGETLCSPCHRTKTTPPTPTQPPITHTTPCPTCSGTVQFGYQNSRLDCQKCGATWPDRVAFEATVSKLWRSGPFEQHSEPLIKNESFEAGIERRQADKEAKIKALSHIGAIPCPHCTTIGVLRFPDSHLGNIQCGDCQHTWPDLTALHADEATDNLMEIADMRLNLKTRIRKLIRAMPNDALPAFETWVESAEDEFQPAYNDIFTK